MALIGEFLTALGQDEHWLWIFAALLFLDGLGVPVIITPVIVLAGTLSRQGNPGIAITLCTGVASYVTADMIGFSAGRLGGGRAFDSLARRFPRIGRRTSSLLQRFGLPGMLPTRLLMTNLSLPVNILLGGNGACWRRFLLWDLLGRTLYLLILGGAGYLPSLANL